jgi:hypothetical protein
MNPDIVDVGKKTQFKPGQSGNPAGPPPHSRIRDLLVAVLKVPLGPEALKLVRPDLRARLRKGETYMDSAHRRPVLVNCPILQRTMPNDYVSRTRLA